jgi:DNA phosphorothioation-associated putative methyltransferase
MVRHALSQPIALLVQHGLIYPGVTVFDYGCGRGDDLRALAAAGVQASGWDPHFAPNEPLVSADIVNLGFVLNVIEDPEERLVAFNEAWGLAKTALVVSTMIAGQVSTDELRPLGDGFLTSRGTFQKYFAHSELRTFVADAVGCAPAVAAPGIVVAFRRAEDHEEFLLRRRMGRRVSISAYRAPRADRQRAVLPAAEERVAPALLTLANLCRMRGRPPAPEEVPAEAVMLLATERVSLQRAIDMVISSVLDPGELEQSASAMRDDLLVHYALARLNRSESAARPSPAMVRDIRAHFGSQREVAAAATDFMLALGDERAIRDAFAQATEGGTAAIDQRGRLLLAAHRRDALPGPLRVYLGCAAYLGGEPSDDAIVRIDPATRTVTYLPVEDWRMPFPTIAGSTTIDLRRQAVRSSFVRRVLLAKSLLVDRPTHAQRRSEEVERRSRDLPDDVLMVRAEL